MIFQARVYYEKVGANGEKHFYLREKTKKDALERIISMLQEFDRGREERTEFRRIRIQRSPIPLELLRHSLLNEYFLDQY